MMLNKNVFLLACCAFFVVQSCTDDDNTPVDTVPNITADVITYTPSAEGRYPENFDFDENKNKFIVGSNWGLIGLLDQNGNYEEFISQTPEGLTSSWGITADEERNLLYIIYLNALTGQTTLGVYTLDNGSLVGYHAVDMSALTNGQFERSAGEVIEIDEDGHVYMSDGYAPVIIKFDINNNYAQSLFLLQTDLGPSAQNPGQFGSGAFEIRNNRLFIFGNNDGQAPDGPKMWTTSMSNPNGDFTEVVINGNLPRAVDGNAFMDDNTIYLTGNSDKEVRRLTTTDDWQTASVSSESFDLSETVFPTEIRKIGADAFVLAGESLDLFIRLQQGQDISQPSNNDIQSFRLYKIEL